jgi:hypothetical protein
MPRLGFEVDQISISVRFRSASFAFEFGLDFHALIMNAHARESSSFDGAAQTPSDTERSRVCRNRIYRATRSSVWRTAERSIC